MALSASDPSVGSELLGYRLEELIGRGGMGVVFRALDLRLKRNVALKLLAPELAEDPRFRERFLRESELAASIDHPNVIPIYAATAVNPAPNHIGAICTRGGACPIEQRTLADLFEVAIDPLDGKAAIAYTD